MKRIAAITAGIVCGLTLTLVGVTQATAGAVPVQPAVSHVNSIGGGCC